MKALDGLSIACRLFELTRTDFQWSGQGLAILSDKCPFERRLSKPVKREVDCAMPVNESIYPNIYYLAPAKSCKQAGIPDVSEILGFVSISFLLNYIRSGPVTKHSKPSRRAWQPKTAAQPVKQSISLCLFSCSLRPQDPQPVISQEEWHGHPPGSRRGDAKSGMARL